MNTWEHRMSIKIADHIDSGERSQEEKIIMVYGIEVFLNEALKIVGALCVAGFFGTLKITIMIMGILCLLRKNAGGMHFDRSIICFLTLIFVVVGIPIFSSIVRLPYGIQVLIAGCTIIVFFLYAPSGTRQCPIKEEEVGIRKIKTILIYQSCLLVGILWRNGTFCQSVLLMSLFLSVMILPVTNRKYKIEKSNC